MQQQLVKVEKWCCIVQAESPWTTFRKRNYKRRLIMEVLLCWQPIDKPSLCGQCSASLWDETNTVGVARSERWRYLFKKENNLYWHLTTVYFKGNWFVIPLSRRHFGDWVAEMSNSSLLKDSAQIRTVINEKGCSVWTY